jgi:peptidoglycan/LPS O-acetylase OafA/YrhL
MMIAASQPVDKVTRTGHSHYYQLDSLRGLAALAVAIHHWHILWTLAPHSKYAAVIVQMLPFRLLIAGHASVMMFFVLSGFVLSLPQVRGKQVDYVPYLVKRVCRIYLPYLVALAVAVLACWKWHGRHAYGLWVDSAWPEAPQCSSILQHLLFIGSYRYVYNFSFWTLVQEMRISLIFPPVCVLAIRFGRNGAAALALGLLLAGALMGDLAPATAILGTTVSYTGMFVVGILLARWLPEMRKVMENLNSKYYWALFAFCVALYAYAPSVFYAMHWNFPAWDGFTAIGAAGLILFSLVDKKLEALLLHRSVTFLGRISYSIYLLHLPVLLTFGFLFYGRLLPIFWIGPYLITTILLATIMYHAVELPAIELGRELASRVSSSASALTASGRSS